MKKAPMALIRFYQQAISPYKYPSCRYLPSCSEYGYEAISRFGALKGGWLTLWRLLRCHPWSQGGFEPVPSSPEEPRSLAIR